MTRDILANQNRILTLSTIFEGEMGIDDTALAVPVIVGSDGIEEILKLDLIEDEQVKLQKAVYAINNAIQQIKDEGII